MKGSLSSSRASVGARTALGALLAGALALGGVGSVARRADAAELAVSGPPSCPDTAELVYRVERAIKMPMAHAAPLQLSVRFDAGARSHSARLSVEASGSTPRSERTLSARACPELADAVALAIALALGSADSRAAGADEAAPGVTRAESEASALPAPAAPAKASPAPADAADGDAGSAEQRGLTPTLLASLVGDAGSLPGVGLGLGLSAELRLGRSALRAGGTLLFDRHVALADGGASAPGADMRSVLGSLVACTSLVAGAPTPPFVCAGWELGRIEAIGTGVEQPRQGGTLWSGPRVDAGVARALAGSPIHLFGQLTVVAPLQRDDFFLRDLGSLYRPPSVVGRLALGAGVAF